MALSQVLGWVILTIATSRANAPADVPVVLENEALRVEFSGRDGAITRVLNKRRNLELVSALPGARQPWALLLSPFEHVTDFETFHLGPPAPGRAHQVDLEWKTRQRISVHATARLDPGSDHLELRCSATNAGDRTIIALRYPAIQGVGTLSNGGSEDRLLHSTMMGAVFFDPFHLFRGNARVPAGRGLTVSRYPNGFHGSPLQMMAYFANGRGGFSLACLDSNAADKDLNFYKDADDRSLVCEVAHIQSDARPGKSLIANYPIVITALAEGTWYEAAEHYRAWALNQPWCRRGTHRDRAARGDSSRWLFENTGTVGAWWPFRTDIRPEVARTRRLYDAPLLHLELWWSNDASRVAAQSEGDHFGPFYFPFLALKGKPTFQAHREAAIVPPATPISPDWVAMCPAQPDWRKVVIESAEDMAGKRPLRHHQIWVDENRTGCQADCLYVDVGPCAGVPTTCYAPRHVHSPGGSPEITRAYVSLFEESQRVASRARGAYVPVGTECVTEPFVGCLDLYYARNAGLNPDMETFPYVRDLSWLPDGRMEVVPLFPFIYHEHGPVAVQGIYPIDSWSTPEAEGFFAWAEARSVLWGGLIVTFPVPARPDPSATRIGYLRRLVAARTGFAREYLAFGRMQRPPEIACGTIAIDHGLAEGGWLRKIRFPRRDRPAPTTPSDPTRAEPSKGQAGELSVEQWATGLLATPIAVPRNATMNVPSVLCQAYTLGSDRLGLIVVNLRANAEESVRLRVDPGSYGLSRGRYALAEDGAGSHRSLGARAGRHEIELKLAPGDVVLVTATRTGG
jgi:hypothetical protein